MYRTFRADYFVFIWSDQSFYNYIQFKSPCEINRYPVWQLEPLDAGAASGLTFTAPRWETTPPDPVARHKPKVPDHPAAGFYYPQLRELPAIAKVEITKVMFFFSTRVKNLSKNSTATMGPPDSTASWSDPPFSMEFWGTLHRKPHSTNCQNVVATYISRDVFLMIFSMFTYHWISF